MTKYEPIKTIPINSDGIGHVAYYPQFAYANMSQQSRIEAITNIASICYANPKAFGSESLYNRLAAESAGLPSSSFEFVPVLLDFENPKHSHFFINTETNIRKFGESILHKESGKTYFLTNYRALYYDYEEAISCYGFLEEVPKEIREKLRTQYLEIYNTQAECDIIAKHFHVFNYNVDLPTRAQMVRHRVNWQELSRRYVSGSKVPFQFYISEKMKGVCSTYLDTNGCSEHGKIELLLDSIDIINMCLNHYQAALDKGVKPEEARRIIPQAAYTNIWGAFQPSYLDNFFKLRLDQHAQKEIREVAQAMQELIS